METMNEKELYSLYQYYFQNPFIGITVCDAAGVCIDVNDTQSKIVGIKKEDFIDESMDKIVEDHKLSNSATLEVIKKKAEVDIHQTSLNGNSYEVKSVPVLDDAGQIVYIISYLLDTTSLTYFKDKLRQMENKIIKSEANEPFVCNGKEMRECAKLAKQIAPTDATVLITGPSGSGKELIADYIHENSNRKDKPFIKLNCGALPEHLLESELFGYEAGSFTGGNKDGSKGIFEHADGGTLLFDEIGDMPVHLQVKLLRVLQDQEVRRIGGRKSVKVDVRIIAATNASLPDLIEKREFREDLYYRLNVLPINVPGLNKRKDDIPGLVMSFIITFNEKYNLNKSIEPDAIEFLESLDYPGNIRELQNLIERIVIQSRKDSITASDVSQIYRNTHEASGDSLKHNLSEKETGKPLKSMVEDFERTLIADYLKKYERADLVAEKLGIDRSTLSRKLHKYQLI